MFHELHDVIHDDELHEHALYHVVKALNEKPETEFIYSDEDKINEQGERIDPHYKSNWNLDLLYSQNYVSGGVAWVTGFSRKLCLECLRLCRRW